VSTRAAVEELVDAYARALESGDIDAVRAAYPGITAGQARDLDNALAVMEELRVDLSVQSLDEQGDQATAVVAGTYSYVNASNGRREQPAVSFIATFERAATGAWRLLQTR
jgi:ketosteroid isomerase-like protein